MSEPPFDDDEDRDAIVARRRLFVAAALAGLASLGLEACKSPSGAGPDGGKKPKEVAPEPCLAVPLVEPDASVDGGK